MIGKRFSRGRRQARGTARCIALPAVERWMSKNNTPHSQPVDREPSGRLGQRSVAPPAPGRQPGALWRTRSARTGGVLPLTHLDPLRGAHRPIPEALIRTQTAPRTVPNFSTSVAELVGRWLGFTAGSTAVPQAAASG